MKQFLSRVADEVRFLRDRLEHLEGARRDAEQRAAHPRLDEETLMVAVGEETATILRTARTAATEIRAKADVYAAQVSTEAVQEAEALRAQAESVLAQRTAEADVVAEGIHASALADAERTREVARQEAATLRQQADQERKLTVEAAQTIREKILTDLARRRKVATVQIEQLRAGRERLLQAYGVVRRTLEEVTDELHRADAEARSAAETAGRRSEAELATEAAGSEGLPAAGSPGASADEAGPAPRTPSSVGGPGRPSLELPISEPVPPGPAEALGPAGRGGSPPAVADAGTSSAGTSSAGTSSAGPGPSAETGPPESMAPQAMAPLAMAPETDPPAVELEAQPAAGGVRPEGPDSAPVEATEGVRILRGPSVPQTPRSGRSRSTNRPPRAMSQGGAAASAAALQPDIDPASKDADRALTLASVPVATPSDGEGAPDTAAVEVDSGNSLPTLPAVDGLFARIRADREQAVARAREVLGGPTADVVAVAGDDLDSSLVPTDAGTQSDENRSPESISDEDEAWLARRDELVGEIESGLARKLKRALQDEQNDLLDRLRHTGAVATAAGVLPDPGDHKARFAAAGRPLLESAARAGATFARGALDSPRPDPDDPTGDPTGHQAGDRAGDLAGHQSGYQTDDLADDLATAIVGPLRRRLEQAFADAGGDETVLTEALGSAYREWKTHRIERAAGDHAAGAFARGAFAVTPEATRLRWLVEDLDGPCPDCDDNALAGGLARGEPFPTGQLHPPAHAGCRCLLVPDAGE